MPLSFFSRKKPIVPANKSAANKEANKAAKHEGKTSINQINADE
jgi:hypothetical protein